MKTAVLQAEEKRISLQAKAIYEKIRIRRALAKSEAERKRQATTPY
jgi:hypothetical protein